MLLSTQRCNIKAITAKDESSVLPLYTNKEVRQYLGGKIEENSFPSKFQRNILHGTLASLGVTLKEGNAFIGLIIIDTHHDREYHEISYQFMPEFWGKGLAKESLTETLNYARDALKLKEIIAETQTRNKNSVRILQKLGMVPMKDIQRFGEQQTIYYKALV